jgi:hypothetical protein
MLSATDHLYWVDSSTSRQAAIGHLLPGATDRYGSISAFYDRLKSAQSV